MEADRIKVWQCAGCGRIDDPRPCIGVCRDEKVEYVLAVDHDREVRALRSLVEALAATTPRSGQWERTYRALQERARALLGSSS